MRRAGGSSRDSRVSIISLKRLIMPTALQGSSTFKLDLIQILMRECFHAAIKFKLESDSSGRQAVNRKISRTI